MLDEFAKRERNRTETKDDNLVYTNDDNGQITRGEVIQLFKELERICSGSFIAGRHGHPSRFQWTLGLPSVGKAAAGEDLPLDTISDEEREQEEQIPEGDRKTHVFPLRPNLDLKLEIPLDLTAREAARLTAFIKSLPFDQRNGEVS